tara:strand:- start:2696 stop:3313 length:618 start_codon:yes stop_codon:yes gene_type:complete
MFTIHKIKDNVESMGLKVFYKNFVSSTNDFIKYKFIQDMVPVVILTNNQRRPRGKRGALWINYNLHSFSFTLCLKLDQKIIQCKHLSQVIGLSIIEGCVDLGISNLKLKHPNDIMKDGKKVGGILIENIIYNENSIYSAIGIGLNISLPEELLDSIDGNPGNLNVKKSDMNELAPRIIQRVLVNIEDLKLGKDDFIQKIKNISGT